ncbi:MAG: phosphate:Na+ symporter [Thermosediminibacterales bacterium]|nr:phosphate:Na+ symporter [Thermosediminibacterales bacterium]
MVLLIIVGLILFLFGFKKMGLGFKNVVSGHIKQLIKLFTDSHIKAIFFGTVITAIIQSSSSMTVIIISLLNENIIEITQAVGLILGANIGTTFTSYILILNLDDLAPFILLIGLVIKLVSKNFKTKAVGDILLGLSFIVFGLNITKISLYPLRNSEFIGHMIEKFKFNPVLGVLSSLILTLIVQSSSATMGFLLALASEGLIDLKTGIPVILGQNLGTCITAFLASLFSNKNGKRAAAAHIIFNFIGIIWAIFLIKPLSDLINLIIKSRVEHQLVVFHTLFNIINVILFLPFLDYYIIFLKKTIR